MVAMANVEALSSSVVREFLSRKGLKDTLFALDKEMPRMDGCISNRPQLAKELGIKSLMRKNKESKENFRTMLEVIVHHMLSRPWLNRSDSQSLIDTASMNSDHDSLFLSPRGNEATQVQKKETSGRDHVKMMKSKSVPTRNEVTVENNSCDIYGNMIAESKTEPESGPVSTPGHDGALNRRTRTALRESPEVAITSANKSLGNEWGVPSDGEKPRSRNRNFGNTIASDIPDPATKFGSKDHVGEQRRQGGLQKKADEYNSQEIFRTPHSNVDNTSIRDGTSSANSNEIFSAKKDESSFSSKTTTRHSRPRSARSGAIMSTGLQSTKRNQQTRIVRESFEEDFDEFSSQTTQPSSLKEDSSTHDQTPLTQTKQDKRSEIPDWKKGIVQSKNSTKKADIQSYSGSTTSKLSEELIFEDVDDNLTEELNHLDKLDISRKPAICSVQGRPITLTIAKDLKTILFGSSSAAFNQEWKNQGFSFSNNERLKYGIEQHKGGPCGLLASVQAVLLKHLLFGDDLTSSSSNKHLRFSSQETKSALCAALTDILWRAGSYEEAFVVIRPERSQHDGYKHDGFTEKLMIYCFSDQEELKSFIADNIHQLSNDEENACILVLYSVILSRTIEKIKDDMDDPRGTLMGAHGYCTQDMVNLVLTGKAVSNTFDNVIELDAGGHTKNILKGIEEQSDIGLLSLFEHYQSCIVGANYKNPKCPIWVVCSESHFSVLFSLRRNVLNERRIPKKFDLYYYDGLARQDEEIRLTVEVNPEQPGHDVHELTPPLELCIRTKWKNASVDWNGTEPLL